MLSSLMGFFFFFFFFDDQIVRFHSAPVASCVTKLSEVETRWIFGGCSIANINA